MTKQRTFAITEVLPHEGRMLLLDELLDYGPQHVVCGVTIREDSMFSDGGGVPSWVGLEYMAQTACAFSGVEEALRGVKPSVALLLGSRRYRTATSAFPIGTRLRVLAELVLRDENDLVAFDCAIFDGERELARGDVKAIRPRDLGVIVHGGRIEQGRNA